MLDSNKIAIAIVVTHNRPRLLWSCLHALINQTRRPDRVIVVDNASSIEIAERLNNPPLISHAAIDYFRLKVNTGGSGGFHNGISRALELKFDWIWLMDDDACPAPEALNNLLRSSPDPNSIYAAVALANRGDPFELVWPITPVGGEWRGKTWTHANELPSTPVTVINSPFIGMLIHRDLLARIGLPDKDFFISSEDGELCARAWKAGARVQLVPTAIVRHPPISRRCLRFGGRQIYVIELPPWRRYYDTRNRLVIARRHFGWRLWTEALPGTLLRWLVTLAVQPDRLAQSRAFARGIYDGVTGRLGMRWPPP